MASRRMFSRAIVSSDHFLDMPVSTRCLYFHLGMEADDDGFINNPKSIMRFYGGQNDDMKLLISKGYLIPFDSGVVVMTHFKANNNIQKDRYKPTICKDEVAQLYLDGNVYRLDTNRIQSGYNMDTQVRLGKDRLGEISKEAPPINKDIREELSRRDLRIRDIILMDTEQGTGKAVKDDDPVLFSEMISGKYPMELASAAISETERMIENGRTLERPAYYMQKLLQIWRDEGIKTAADLDLRH